MSIVDSINGTNWDNNPTFLHTPNLAPNGTQHTAVLSVRKDGIKAYVDGKLMARHPTNFGDVSLEQVWKLPGRNTLGLGFHNSQGMVLKVQLKEVTGKGAVPEGAPAQQVENGAF